MFHTPCCDRHWADTLSAGRCHINRCRASFGRRILWFMRPLPLAAIAPSPRLSMPKEALHAGENLTRQEMIHQPRMSGFGTKQTYMAEPTRSAQERMADIPSCNVSPFGKQRM